MYCYFYLNSYKNNCLLWRVSRFCATPGIIWKIVLINTMFKIFIKCVYKIKFFIYSPEKYYAQYSVPNIRKGFTPTIIQLSCAAAS